MPKVAPCMWSTYPTQPTFPLYNFLASNFHSNALFMIEIFHDLQTYWRRSAPSSADHFDIASSNLRLGHISHEIRPTVKLLNYIPGSPHTGINETFLAFSFSFNNTTDDHHTDVSLSYHQSEFYSGVFEIEDAGNPSVWLMRYGRGDLDVKRRRMEEICTTGQGKRLTCARASRRLSVSH